MTMRRACILQAKTMLLEVELIKHEIREGRALPSVKGSPYEINAQCQKIADEILSNPATTAIYKDTGRFGKIMDVIAPDGADRNLL